MKQNQINLRKSLKNGFNCQINIMNIGAFLAVILGLCNVFTSGVIAQVVKQPLSEVTTNIKHYNYDDFLSPTQKKVIEYIIIKSSTGEIKTTFNACDVCYAQHKGYSQSGTDLRCTNCGNRFNIDALGSQGTGGCNPGYLPHSIDGDSVVLNVSDLKKGEYYFLTIPVTGVVDETSDNNTSSYILINNNFELNLKMPTQLHRNFRIVSLTGQIISTFASDLNEINIKANTLSSGLYLLNIQEEDKTINKFFMIY